MLLALDGSVVARGLRRRARDRRRPTCSQDYLTTALAPDEVVTEIRVPAPDGYGFGYQKFNRRAEDWAMVGVCAVVRGERRHRARTCASG